MQANEFDCFNHKNRFEKKESYDIRVWYIIIINQHITLYLHCILKVGCVNGLKKYQSLLEENLVGDNFKIVLL